MSLEPTLEEQAALAESFSRDRSPMSRSERAVSLLSAVALALCVAALWAIAPPPSFSVPAAALCLCVLSVAVCVRFDTPFGWVVPTQLAFVPLLFVVPAALVPLAVALAVTVGRLPDVLRGRAQAARLWRGAGNSLYAVGPATVFALAHTPPTHAGWPLLVAALAAQFVVDFTVIALQDLATGSASLRAQLRETWVYGIDAGLSGIGLIVGYEMHARPAAVLTLLPLLAILHLFARERHARLNGLLELSSAYRGTALVLGDVIEADDGYTGEHCRSVVSLALALADRLRLDGEQRRNLEFAALLHDVGKIAIPKAIINKPGPLDPEEWALMKTHTIEGQRLLSRIGGFMREVGVIVRAHHERWDGRGYPDGLAGEAIPLEARMITCCDSWNAMRTDRVYRPALTHEAAVAELVRGSGGQFDPRLVDAFLPIIEADDDRRADDRLEALASAARALEPSA